MRLLLLALSIMFGIQYAIASFCKELDTNQWVCRHADGTVTRIVYSKNTYWFKTYYPEMKGAQTEATYVSKSSVADFGTRYTGACQYELWKYRPDIELDDRKQYCTDRLNAFLHGSDDNELRSESIQLLYNVNSGTTYLHAVYCMSHNYVRTYDYDQYTELEINRKDYHDLISGSYCTEFIRTNKVKWIPPRYSSWNY
jgi:hypothetical protein